MPYSDESAANKVNPQDDTQTIFMSINENTSSFHIKQADADITLPVGFEMISNKYFKHTPPTYDDIEYAINYIEDEIEKVVPLIRADNTTLVSNNSFIRTFALLSGAQDAAEVLLQRDDLEYLFGQYAEIAMGRPPRPHETDISPLFYAKLLIFREFMHHLKFDHILIK